MGRSHSINPEVLGDGQAVSKAERYALPAIVLHWLMGVLLIGQIAIGLYMVELPKRTPEVAYYYNLHKSLGLVALMLVTIRLWRRLRAKPPVALHTSVLQEKAASVAHRLLYACMVLIPLTGFIGSSFGKYPVKFFGYALPHLGWESPGVQAFFRQAHAVLVWLLCALIAVHLLAVIHHIATSGTRILRRMLP